MTPSVLRNVGKRYGENAKTVFGAEEHVHLGGAPLAGAVLGPGFHVGVRIFVFEAVNVLRLPNDALARRKSGVRAAFRIVDGRARLTGVAIGDGDDPFRRTTSGVEAGDGVGLFPREGLRDGDDVQVITK